MYTDIPGPGGAAPEIPGLVEQVAAELKETNPDAVNQIRLLVRVMGDEFVQTVLQQTLEVEQSGGMTIQTGKRRRSPGGVFFYLAKEKMTPEQRSAVFPVYVQPPPPKPASVDEELVVETRQFYTPMSRSVPVELEIAPQARQLAQNIARKLNENDPDRLEVFARIVQVGGVDLARVALQITLDMEEQGGLKKRDGTRRSPGGAFLYISSRRLKDEQRRLVWPELPDELVPPVAPATATRQPAGTFSTSQTSVSHSTSEPRLGPRPPAPPGIATTAKITLVGRPTLVQRRDGYVAFQMQNNRPPNLPRGLPIPNGATQYSVYVVDRQWDRVAAAVENPQDALIVEGYPVVDPKIPGVLVYATSVFNKLSQQNRRPPTRGEYTP